MPWVQDGKFLVERNFGFGLKGLKNYPELIPLVSAIGFACLMGSSYMGYALMKKPDVKVRKSAELEPHERVNPDKPQKLYTIQQKWSAIPELESLRKEIGSYKC